MRGLILRRTLIGLLKNKAFSTPTKDGTLPDGGIILQQTATIPYDTLERPYPNFPDIKNIKIQDRDLNYWLDVRQHMDGSAPMVADCTSIRRVYTLFRTMGLRHLCVVDGDLRVVGMITRYNMDEHRLKHFWESEGEQLQKDMNIDSMPPAVVYDIKEDYTSRGRSGTMQSNLTIDSETDVDPELLSAKLRDIISDSPPIVLRKKILP
jgi:CBS domain-containing protein